METQLLLTEDWEPPSCSNKKRAAATAAEAAATGPEPSELTDGRSQGLKIVSIDRKPACVIGEMRRTFRDRFFPEATDRMWSDWRWQVKNRITDVRKLSRMLRLSEQELSALTVAGSPLPFAVTPYYAALLDPENPDHALRRAVVPVSRELTMSFGEADDPLGEDGHSPVPGLVHRYPDRVLFLATGFCSTYCRYCTRSRLVGHGSKDTFLKGRWEKAIAYIAETPQVRDVLISGGDPLTLDDAKLEWLLSKLREIPHVEIVRLGTKVPMVLPQRVTPALTRMLRKFHPLWISIHCMHPEEITEESSEACRRLADAGIPLGSQTVLLAGINDSVPVMKSLVQGLLRIRVRPYYLYQCDPITGSSHFRTPVEKGLEIIYGLRGHTSGYAVPHYVVDAPGGGGKIPLLPQYAQGFDSQGLVLKNYEGKTYHYPDAGPGASL
ncbi:MAG: KamA family radical SAM protein [Thermodesulfobacteriota bacterium]